MHSVTPFNQADKNYLDKSMQPNMIKYITSTHKKIVICFCIALYFLACSKAPKAVQDVISLAPKHNKLNNVIEHYRSTGESDKLAAAYYLIENLSGKYHYEGKGVSQYQQMFAKIRPGYNGKGLSRTWDSLELQFRGGFPAPVHKVEDLRTVDDAYLIAHIDAAFRTRKYPWTSRLSFDDFCKYILPYKMVNERPDLWLLKLEQKQRPLLSLLSKNSDAYEACLLLNERLKKEFHFDTFPTKWDLNYSELDKLKAGSCYHATQYAAYSMRAMGIPVVMDFTPFWGNLNGGHEWNALIFNNKPIPFVGGESDPGKTKIDLAFQRKRGKVFRHSFALQPLEPIHLSDDKVPSFLRSRQIEDVTRDYIPTSEVRVDLNKVFPDKKFAYIAVFNRQIWVPLYWGKIDDDGKAVFKDMGRQIAYLPMYYDSGKMIPASDPLIVEADGQIKSLRFGKGRPVDITISKKGPGGPPVVPFKVYELSYWKDGWVKMDPQVARSNQITFSKVPANTIYWLHNEEKINKERIFTYANNEIQWW